MTRTLNLRAQFLSVSETADYLNVSTKTIYRLVEEGSLPCIRVGKAIRISIDDLRRYTNNARRSV